MKCIELHTHRIEGTAFIANLTSVTEEKPSSSHCGFTSYERRVGYPKAMGLSSSS